MLGGVGRNNEIGPSQSVVPGFLTDSLRCRTLLLRASGIRRAEDERPFDSLRRQAQKDDILHGRLERRRETDDVPLAIGLERDVEFVRYMAVRYLGQFEGFVVTVNQFREQAAP